MKLIEQFLQNELHVHLNVVVFKQALQPFQAWSGAPTTWTCRPPPLATLVTRPAPPRTIRPPPPPRRRPRARPPRHRRRGCRTGIMDPTGPRTTGSRTSPTQRPGCPRRRRVRPRPPSSRSSTTSTPGRSTFPDLVSLQTYALQTFSGIFYKPVAYKKRSF